MARSRPSFSRAEAGLIATAAAIVFTRVFAFSLTTAGFTEYAKLSLMPAGTTAAQADVLAGVAFGAYGLTMAGAQLATGWLSDRIGRRPVLLGGTLLFVAGAVVSALASNIWLLIAGRLVAGLGGVSSSAMAAVGETVPAERRTTAMALVGIPAGLGVFLGFIIGPLLVGTAQHPGALPFASLFWITGGLGLVAAVPVLLRPLPSPLPGVANARRSLGLPVMALAAAGFTINFAMMAVTFDFLSVLGVIGNTAFAGLLLGAFVVMGGVSRAVDRSGQPWRAIVAALVLLAAAAPIFRISATFGIAVTAGLVFFAAHATLSAILPSQVSRLAGRSGGTGHGIQLVVAYLGTWAGATSAGYFASRDGLVDAFVLLAGVALVAAAMVAWSLRPGPTGVATAQAAPDEATP